MVVRVEEAELDAHLERVSNRSKRARWLWQTSNRQSGQVLADVLTSHQDAALKQLKQLRSPFAITHFYTDGWSAAQRLLEESCHPMRKAHTIDIERKHLTLRTRIERLARKTICSSKSEWLHDIVIG